MLGGDDDEDYEYDMCDAYNEGDAGGSGRTTTLRGSMAMRSAY